MAGKKKPAQKNRDTQRFFVGLLICGIAIVAFVVSASSITGWYEDKPSSLAMTAEPTQRIVVDGDVMYLEGLVPDQDAADSLQAAAVAAVGPGRVVNNLQVSDRATFSRSRPIKLTSADPVLFNTGVATLDEQYRPLIDIAVELMKTEQTSTLSIIGHADDTGTPEANIGLSLRRAQAVGALVLEQGIDLNRLTVDGRGQAEPLKSNSTEQGRATNRRVDVAIYGMMNGT